MPWREGGGSLPVTLGLCGQDSCRCLGEGRRGASPTQQFPANEREGHSFLDSQILPNCDFSENSAFGFSMDGEKCKEKKRRKRRKCADD